MIAHAREEAPNECCGLLVGAPGRVDGIVRCTNLDASPVRFRLDPKQHIDATRRLRGSASAVVGVYHSHPASPAEPSETDVAEAHYPEFVWIIVSLADAQRPDLRAYSISGGTVSPLEIQVHL